MCINIVLKELSKSYPFSSIVTWNWDPATSQTTGRINKATLNTKKRYLGYLVNPLFTFLFCLETHALSHDAWSLSFAKFLELQLSSLSFDNESNNTDCYTSTLVPHQYFMHR